MGYVETTFRQRLPGAIGALIVSALLGLVLVWGLRVPVTRMATQAVSVFALSAPLPPPPPPRAPPPRVASRRPQGAQAPPNLRSRPTEIVSPPVPAPLPQPPPVVTAPIAGAGVQASAGAADQSGPGTGAGGIGSGTGSGGAGEGDGGGDESAPRLVQGRIKNSDFPKAAASAGRGGTVSVRYVVRADGRVGACSIARSSGDPDLDATTCRLIQERFRFEPSRKPDGTPVEAEIEEDHSWIIHNAPPEPDR